MKHKIARDELKKNLPDVIAFIQSKHEMPKWVEDALFHNPKFKPQKGLTTTGIFFAMAAPLYLQYTMGHVILNPETGAIGRRIDEVIIYDTYIEYEADRVTTLQNRPKSVGLHLN